MNKTEYKKFFKGYSKNVDSSNSLGFWKLTDEIILTALLDNLNRRERVTIVDFGGGTGRWLEMLDNYFRKSSFILIDLSEDMIKRAKMRKAAGEFKNDLNIIQADIGKVPLENCSSDYVISTYNPLSFCDDPQKVISEAYRVLKHGGRAMVSAQSYYNAIYSKINNFLVSGIELRSIYENKKVRWTDNVPELWQFKKSDMERMFTSAGFKEVCCRGIATLVQPQNEDFDPENRKLGALSKKLNQDKSFYNEVLKIELQASKDPDAIDRSMNIMAIGTK